MTEIRRVALKGLGRFLPEKVVTNFDLEKTVDTFERIADLNTNYKTAAKKLYLAASICEKKR